jgi:catechol 2,3-dioxygenase-like lactoylglutathione lyase family enzyme
MILRLDHVVIVVPELTAATERYRRRGFDVVRGGGHKNFGSANALIGFGDGVYLELFCFVDRAKASPDHPLWTIAEAGGGLAVYWLGTDDVDDAVTKLREQGFDYTPPSEMNRTRADGKELRFRVATPSGKDFKQLPFLIQDLTARKDRLPPPTSHANGVAAVTSVIVAVPAFEPVKRCFEALLGQQGEAGRDAALDAATLTFTVGSTTVVLAQPDDGGSFAKAAAAVGWGPYAVVAPSGAKLPALEGSFPYDARILAC